MGAKQETLPTLSQDDAAQKAAHIIVAESYAAPDGSVYVHKDLVQAVAPWAVEQHIGPAKAAESFGDVESWADYVKRYGGEDEVYPAYLTWSEKGLRAVLDYHGTDQEPNRCRWTAEMPFVLHSRFKRWQLLANGAARSQREVLEAFEDCAEDIVDPVAADLVTLVRALRATSQASANTELRPDGTTKVSYTKNQTIAAGEATIPPTLTLAVPVLKGHVTATPEGKRAPVLYSLTVRLRVSVDDQARPSFRLGLTNAEQTLEAVFEDRVQAARAALGDGYTVYRATA